MSLNILSWNVRGSFRAEPLGEVAFTARTNVRGAASRRSLHNIKNLIRFHRLHILIILEPRISEDRADDVCRGIGFSNFFRVEASGFSVGILILWNADTVDLEILAYSDQMIHAIVSLPGISNFLLKLVYGSPDSHDRKGLWHSLVAASTLHSLPFLVLVDFNQVLSAEEKLGRRGFE